MSVSRRRRRGGWYGVVHILLSLFLTFRSFETVFFFLLLSSFQPSRCETGRRLSGDRVEVIGRVGAAEGGGRLPEGGCLLGGEDGRAGVCEGRVFVVRMGWGLGVWFL